MVFSAVLFKIKPGVDISIVTFVGLLLFIFSLFGLVPTMVFGIRLDMLLLLLLGLYTLISCFIMLKSHKNEKIP